MRHYLVVRDLPDSVDLVPGGHLVLLTEKPVASIDLRKLDLEIRDTILVIGPTKASLAVLARRACEGTVAENVLKHGAGALNIDACRVPYTEDIDFDRQQRQQQDNGVVSFGAAGLIGKEIPLYKQGGRWPSNLVFVHTEQCARAGQEWECSNDCLVSALDGQTGTLKSGNLLPTHKQGSGKNSFQGWGYGNLIQGVYGGDSGGASRFFSQFNNLGEFLAWLERLVGAPETNV